MAGVAGVGVLRVAWAHKRRSHPLNLAGWLLILVGAVCGWAAAGAWGLAVTSLWPMGAAMVLLAFSGLGSQPGKQRASNRRVGALPDRGEPLRLAGRILTFVLVVLAAATLGVGIAVAVAGLALMAGAGEANAYSLALMLMPLAWAVLAYLLLMQPSRCGQAKVLAVASLPLWPCVAMGLLS
ncbi:hypothetical protein [Novosphingobium sp. 9U]|uniref:hypothetical protein n=1 Tax=Novosphingobium sp. 9U TaxID=2653158 RepID=UPI001359A5BD|nr:hypothetical protein [Novosphingobium sp. 9U]